MIIQVEFDNTPYKVDLSKPLDISIPLTQGENNPNCYYAQAPEFETIEVDDFIGSVARGGSVNYQRIHITPHGNGTHTEVYGHITSVDHATIANNVISIHGIAEVMSIRPDRIGEDEVITLNAFKKKRKSTSQAVIIRTIPNTDSKKTKRYSNTNPPYLDFRVAQILKDNGVKHLLIDLPSVDREVDGGELKSHRAFWNTKENPRADCTITELVYIPDEIPDGLYFLNLQIINLDSDACPSRPVLFKLIEP